MRALILVLPILALAGLAMACDSDPVEHPPLDTEAVKAAVVSGLQAHNKAVTDAHAELSASHAKLAAQLSASSEQLGQLGTQLDALERKLDEKPAAPALPPPSAVKPGRPDPKLTYKVVVGDAHFKGRKDAKVTIVEWSDFQ